MLVANSLLVTVIPFEPYWLLITWQVLPIIQSCNRFAYVQGTSLSWNLGEFLGGNTFFGSYMTAHACLSPFFQISWSTDCFPGWDLQIVVQTYYTNLENVQCFVLFVFNWFKWFEGLVKLGSTKLHEHCPHALMFAKAVYWQMDTEEVPKTIHGPTILGMSMLVQPLNICPPFLIHCCTPSIIHYLLSLLPLLI